MNRRTILKGGLVLAATAHTTVASGDKARTSPQERIDAALAQIEQAMTEMYPGWAIDRAADVVCPQRNLPGGGIEELPPIRHVVGIYAHEDRYGPEKFGWYVNYV